jgi:hypothetical protein
MMKPYSLLLFALVIVGLVAAGCASGANPAQVVEDYFTAIINDDVEQLAALTCSAHEAEAITTATSFRNTGAELQDMQCSLTPDSNIVQCQGKIVVSYQAELREFPLGSYRIEQEGDTWLVCGEAQ